MADFFEELKLTVTLQDDASAGGLPTFEPESSRN